MPKKNYYYLVQHLDIDGDKNPDGFLITKYKIDKNNNRIFLKSKYVNTLLLNKVVDKFQKKLSKKMKGGADSKVNNLDEINQLKEKIKQLELNVQHQQMQKNRQANMKNNYRNSYNGDMYDEDNFEVMEQGQINRAMNKNNYGNAYGNNYPPRMIIEQPPLANTLLTSFVGGFAGGFGGGLGLGIADSLMGGDE
jgi:hypothetical protein